MVFGWTQNDGAMNAGPPHLIQNEGEIIPVIKSFAHGLSNTNLSDLLSHYKASDFTEDVQNYDQAKRTTDPEISVHYFRLSRILRDLLFVCSSIDFGYQMSRQSEHADVYLYSLNQSMLTPLFQNAGMAHIGVAHGSDTNYIFNGVFPEGEVSEKDQKLSTDFATAFITFAYTGSPNGLNLKGEERWSPAFGRQGPEPAHSAVSTLDLHIIGGPYGSGSVRLASSGSSSNNGSDYDSEPLQAIGNEGEILEDPEFAAMLSISARLRKEVMDRELMLQRCAVINSLSAELGV
jgi:hypothetical protein